MSNTNTEVLTTAYEKLQGAITQSNTVLPKLQEAIEKGNLDEVRKKDENITLNDCDSEMLTAIQGGEGTSFDLLSIRLM